MTFEIGIAFLFYGKGNLFSETLRDLELASDPAVTKPGTLWAQSLSRKNKNNTHMWINCPHKFIFFFPDLVVLAFLTVNVESGERTLWKVKVMERLLLSRRYTTE